MSTQDLPLVRAHSRLLAEIEMGLRRGDPRDLAQSGWGVIFAADDPQANATRDALRELLDLRRSQAGSFHANRYGEYLAERGYQSGDTKRRFLSRHGVGLGAADPDQMPYYLLIIGHPEVIPYDFQESLDIQYGVGRLYFETPDEYALYARNVVALETSGLEHVSSATFFAPLHSGDRATELSAKELTAPLAATISEHHRSWKVQAIIGEEATKGRLSRLLCGKEPTAFLFTAGHGVVFPSGHPLQRPRQGAILCSDWPGLSNWEGPVSPDFYFSADDLVGIHRAKGLLSFHYSAFSAGWPAWDHQWQKPVLVSPEAYLAQLPQRLLTAGALAAVGFTSRTLVGNDAQWSWLQVIEDAISRLLSGFPVGAAMEPFGQYYAEIASELSVELENWTSMSVNEERLAKLQMISNELKGCLVVGDPAVRICLPATQRDS